MNNCHPNEITLLRLAFPREDCPVAEHWAWHVLLCKQCAQHILTMRKMHELQATTSAAPIASPASSAYSPPKSFNRAIAAGGAVATTGAITALSVGDDNCDTGTALSEISLFEVNAEDTPIAEAEDISIEVQGEWAVDETIDHTQLTHSDVFDVGLEEFS